MVEFYDLKNHLLKDLSHFCKNLKISSGDYYTYETKVNVSSLKELLPFLKDVTTCYMKSPSGTELLGIGSLRFFRNSLEINEIDELLQKYPKLEFLGALPFHRDRELTQEWSEFKNSHFFIPQVVLCRENKVTILKVTFKGTDQDNSLQEMNLTTEVNSLLTFIHRDPVDLELEAETSTTDEAQWSRLIKKSQEDFKKTDLKKVVLARGKSFKYKNEVDPNILFTNFKSGPNLYEFFYHVEDGPSFISFTPEKLFSVHNKIIVVDSIAGTLKKQDNNKGSDLLQSHKDMEEHRYVSNFIKESLHSICSDVSELFKEELLKLPSLYHIHSRYRAKLKDSTTISSVIEHLHPTPAVGGFPKRDALKFISENENLNRGLYAGPIGRISKDASEFAVGIRSLLVSKDKIYFYGGAGIVKQSMAISEWHETGHKIESVQCMM